MNVDSNQPPRVAYLTNQYPYGSHTFIRREIQALEELGVAIERFSIRDTRDKLTDPRDVEEYEKTISLLNYQCVLALLVTSITCPMRTARALAAANRLRRSASSGFVRMAAVVAEAAYFARLCRTREVGHVHAHFGTNSTSVAMLANLLGGPAYSFTVHGPDEFDRPESYRLGEKIAHCKFVAAVSSYGRSQLYRWCRYEDWPKVRVVHCGVDQRFVEEQPTDPSESPRFLCIGRLSEQKGQLLLVEAARQLHEAGFDFEIRLAGDGPLRGEIEDAINAGGLQGKVTLLGWCDGERVIEELRQCRAMVLPSFAEGLPVVIMEALALGRPVITTSIAGIPELVRPGENGWLIPAGDAGAIASAIRECCDTDSQKLTTMGANGREAVFVRHSVKCEAEKLLELVLETR